MRLTTELLWRVSDTAAGSPAGNYGVTGASLWRWGQTFILGISSLGGLLSPVWAPGAAKSLSPDTADHGASFERRSAWPVAAIRGSPLSYTTS